MSIDWKATSASRVEEGDGWVLLLGDSLRIARELPPESFDAMICDPPYSSGGFVRSDRNGATGDKYSKSGSARDFVLENFQGDNRDQRSFLAWGGLWLWDCRQLVRSGGAGFVFTDWRQLPITTDAFQVGGWIWRGIFSWDKLGAHRRAGYGRFSARCEYGVWGSNGPMTYETDSAKVPDLEILEGSCGCSPVPTARRSHVTEKPVPVMDYVCRVCPKGGIVFDPFAGVGSTGVGALSAGRRFVGIELDPKAFERAAKRLEQASKRTALLVEAVVEAPKVG